MTNWRRLLRRVRQSHALEHATLHVLSRAPRPPRLVGRSDELGYTLFGDVETSRLRRAAHEALAQLNAGQHDMAVHPRCGTNLVVPALATGLASGNYHMDAGFVSGYPPPGEVRELLFQGASTLEWQPEGSSGQYNLYRDLLSNLFALGYGACEQYDIADETTTDPDPPPVDDGFFYLVTVENRLEEEGTKGADSAGSERPNPDPCP